MRAEFVLLILAMGAITYATRVTSFAVLRLTGMPAWLRRAVRYVPVGVLVALILPTLLIQDDRLALHLGNHYLIAGVFTAFVAWKTKNVAVTVGLGLAAVFALAFIGL